MNELEKIIIRYQFVKETMFEVLISFFFIGILFLFIMYIKQKFAITGLVEKIFYNKICRCKLERNQKFKMLIENKLIELDEKQSKYILTDRGLNMFFKSYDENANILNTQIAVWGVLISLVSMSIALFSIIINSK